MPVKKTVTKKSVSEYGGVEKYPSKKAMMKHEMAETPRTKREELIQRASVKGAAPRRSVPVAPRTSRSNENGWRCFKNR